MFNVLAGVALASALQCEQPRSYADIPVVLIAPKNNETLTAPNAEIILGSILGESVREVPWSRIVDVEVIPQAGPVYVMHPANVQAAVAPFSVQGINNPITRLLTMPVHYLPPGQSYRIVMTQIDPADPPGCPVHVFKTVLGQFSIK